MWDTILRGNANFAVVTFAVDFCQLAKVIFLLDFRRTLYKTTALAKNLTFANWQKSTAKVTTAKFMLPKDDPMNKETVLTIEKRVQALLTSLTRINLVKLFENDSISAKQLFYSYLNLLNLSPMKSYFQRQQMQQFLSIPYVEFLSIILSIYLCRTKP